MAIKVFKSQDAGAPALTGMVGSLITVLDAVLVNGYNSVSVSGITRTGATATVTTAAPHGLATGDSATISGAVETDYNADAVVTVVDSTRFTYAVSNSPTTPATGTITCKRSSAGFTKTFSGASKATYRANDLSSARHTLRVLDDGLSGGGSGEARVFAFETMTDVDSGTGPYPTTAQSGGNGYYWRKSSTNDSTARAWMIVTDGKLVYYFCDYAAPAAGGLSGNSTQFSGAFGDIIPYKPGDAYASILTGCTTANTSNPPSGLFQGYSSISSASNFSSSIAIARDFTAVAGARYVGLLGTAFSTTIGSNAAIAYPHLIDSGFYMGPIMVTQGTPSLIRGRLPGAYESLHGRCFNNGDTISNVQGMVGRTFMMVYGSNSSTSGAMMIDVTGPWDS